MSVSVCLPLLLALATVAPEPPNLLANPGFEDGAAPWALQPGAKLVETTPHAGRWCLEYRRTDPEQYQLVAIPVTLEPGRPYEISAWIRTAGVTAGEAGAATICLEWTKQGQYYEGCYPQGIAGDQGWTRVSDVAKVPADADRTVRLVCYLRRKSVGTAWFDDLCVRRVTTWPAVNRVYTHAYRDRTAGAAVKVAARLELDWAGLRAESARVSLAVRDAGGRVAATLKPDRLTSDRAEFTVDPRDLPVGDYELACQVTGPDGVERGRGACRLHRLARLPDCHAYVDEHQRLIVDGQPFFPLGTYWNTHYHRDDHTPAQRQAIYQRHPNSRDRQLLDLYAQSPFNCLMPYDSPAWQPADLDYARAKGLSVIFSVKDGYHGICDGYRMSSPADERGVLEREVRRVGGHPAIIAWYTNDEVDPAEPRLRLHQQWMEELDPGRPTWAVSFHKYADYLDTADVFGMDWYPVPWTQPGTVLDKARQAAVGLAGARAMWHVPQISDVGTYGDIHKSRPPTLDELRAMAWMCLTSGANGLVFYSFFDLIRAEDLQPFDGRWADITKMAREIRDLEPVLLSVEPAPRPTSAPAADSPVSWRVYGERGGLVLAVVNSQREATTATFAFPTPFSRAEALLGGAPVAVSGGKLNLELGPLAVKVMRLR